MKYFGHTVKHLAALENEERKIALQIYLLFQLLLHFSTLIAAQFFKRLVYTCYLKLFPFILSLNLLQSGFHFDHSNGLTLDLIAWDQTTSFDKAHHLLLGIVSFFDF